MEEWENTEIKQKANYDFILFIKCAVLPYLESLLQ